MRTLTINSNVSSIGNYTDTDIPLTGIDDKIKSVKTLSNGIWKSWTPGTPDAFQGILKIDKGKGFVVNSTGTVDLPISDNDLDVNTMDIELGLNLLCYPYNNKPIAEGTLPRIKASSFKTLIGTWKSWSVGAPDAFQGFTNINKNNGLVCNVTKVFSKYNNNNSRDLNTGVRIGTAYINTDTANADGLVEFTPDETYQTINYDIVAVDPATPKLDLWIKLGTTVKLLKYPTEMTNKRFNIKKVNLVKLDSGSIIDAVVETEANGVLTEVPTITEDLGDIISGFGIANIIYNGIFAPNIGNSKSNPLTVSDVISLSSAELMYDELTISPTTNYNTMHVEVLGNKLVLEFADEYLGKPLVIINNNTAFNTTFIINDTFLTL